MDDLKKLKIEYKKSTRTVTEEKKKRKVLVFIIIGIAITLGILSYFVAYPLISFSTGNYTAYINIYDIDKFKLPKNTTQIKSKAFYGCDAIQSITIPKNVSSIGSAAFSGCSTLENVYITDIANWCNISFGDGYANPLFCADNLYLDGELTTKLVIPDGVTSIGSYAFFGCSALTSITIPDSVTSIGASAFYNCNNLTSITIPDSVTSIGASAFYNCNNLTSINIPDSVTSIGNDAFYNCNSLTSINIPDSVTSIGRWAFNGCSNITNATLPAFAIECIPKTKLQTVTITSGTGIASDAFRKSSNLTSVTICDGVKSIGSNAFYGCISLTSVIIPISVVRIEYDVFNGCYSLKDIKYRGTHDQWNAVSKSYSWDSGIERVTIDYKYDGS